jgi:hypothetical protein
MTAAAIRAVPAICDVCSMAPCRAPGFCQFCHAADTRVRQQRITENLSHPTPRSTIEAIRGASAKRLPKSMQA